MNFLSQNERKLLKDVYRNYLEHHTKEYTFRITSSDSCNFINTLHSLRNRGIIKPISSNFDNNIISLCEKYVFEITDDGIDLAEKSGL